MRGEIAEAEVRWRDAARHYATLARLAPVEANLARATRMAMRAGDVAAFDHFAAIRVERARAEHAEDSPEREAILGAVLDEAWRIPSTLDLDALREETIGRRLRRAGLDRPGAFMDALTEHLGGDPKVDTELMPALRYREARRRVLRFRGRAECRTDYATALLDLAGASVWMGRGPSGLVLARAAIALRTADLGPAHPDTLAAHDELGIRTGMVLGAAAAEKVHRETLEFRLKVFGRRHREPARGLALLAFQLWRQDRYDDAAACYRDAISVLRRLAPLDEEDSGLLEGTRASLGAMHRYVRRPRCRFDRKRRARLSRLDIAAILDSRADDPALPDRTPL